MVIFSFICITDTLSLFTWNLDHFLKPNFNIYIETLNEPMCRIFTFLQYTSLQSSAILLSFACIDRYFTVIAIPGSFYQRLPFGTSKLTLIWCATILIALTLANCFLLVLPRHYRTNGTVVCYTLKDGFRVDNLWS